MTMPIEFHLQPDERRERHAIVVDGHDLGDIIRYPDRTGGGSHFTAFIHRQAPDHDFMLQPAPNGFTTLHDAKLAVTARLARMGIKRLPVDLQWEGVEWVAYDMPTRPRRRERRGGEAGGHRG